MAGLYYDGAVQHDVIFHSARWYDMDSWVSGIDLRWRRYLFMATARRLIIPAYWLLVTSPIAT